MQPLPFSILTSKKKLKHCSSKQPLLKLLNLTDGTDAENFFENICKWICFRRFPFEPNLNQSLTTSLIRQSIFALNLFNKKNTVIITDIRVTSLTSLQQVTDNTDVTDIITTSFPLHAFLAL